MKDQITQRWMGFGVGLCLLVGLFFVCPADASPTKPLFPSFAELIGWQIEEGDEATGDETFEVDEVNPDIFDALSTDILTQAELGFDRPGEIAIRPDRYLKVGALNIYPLLRQSFIFDDNINLTDTVQGEREGGNPNPHVGVRESDIIAKTDVGFLSQLEFSEGDHLLEFGGQIENNEFLQSSLEYREEYYGANVKLNFNKLSFSVGDRWEHRYDPIEIQFTNKLERVINTAFASAAVDVDAFRLEVDFHREDSRYIDFKQNVGGGNAAALRSLDRAESAVEVRPMMAIDEATFAFIEYAYLVRNMDEQALPDATANRFSVGVTGTPNDRMRLWVRVGWIDEDFDTDAFSLIDPTLPPTPGNISPFVDPHDSRNGDVVGEVRVEYDLEDLTRVDFSYQRVSQFSTASNFQMVDRMDVAFLKQFYPNLLGRVGGYYEYQRPSNTNNSSRFGVGIGLQYLISSWVTLDADYAYRRRNSSVKTGSGGSDYFNNVLGVGATVRF